MNYLKSKIRDIQYKLDFLRVYNSPFKPLKLKYYVGEVAIGTPYFFPRKWVRLTKKEAYQKALDKKTPESITDEKMRDNIFQSNIESFKRGTKPVPKKIGFDFIPMRWKTKWGEYRFETSPVWSFVFFKWQIVITFIAPELDHYWECWLHYTNETDKNKSTKERIAQARKEFPCIWTTNYEDIKEKVCYWDLILKDKYVEIKRF